MQCERGHANDVGARFCIACGLPLAAQTSPQPGSPASPGPTRSKRPALIAGGAIAAVLVVIAGIGLTTSGSSDSNPSADAPAAAESSDAAPSPSATKAPYIDLLTDPAKLVMPGQCDSLEEVVDRWDTTAKEALASSKKATKDAWAAASYAAENAWVDTSPDTEFEAEIAAIIDPALDSLTGGRGDLVQNQSVYVTDVMRECQIVAKYGAADRKVSDMASRGRVIAADAATKPWYPKGYNEYLLDDTIAWKWLKTSQFDCDYYYATCWGMSIVAKDGCPTGLYAEIDIKDSSGQKVSYSNDLSNYAGPGEKVKFVFNDFTDGRLTGSLNKINCY